MEMTTARDSASRKLGQLTGGAWEAKSPKTARVFASVFSMSVPVNPMNDALGKASRRLNQGSDAIRCARVASSGIQT